MKSLRVINNPKPATEFLSCGDCKACCTVFEIEEIQKPDRTPCQHLCKTGCGVYETRPKMCKEFYCMWIQKLIYGGDIRFRPDNIGVVLTVMETPPFTGVIGVFAVDHKKPLPPKALKFLWELSKKALYFHNEKLNGPQDQIDAWKKKWRIDVNQEATA